MYRKKYLIGVYAPVSEGETLLGLCASIGEFAEFMGIGYANAKQILHLLFVGKTSRIRKFGRLCDVAFILDVEDAI